MLIITRNQDVSLFTSKDICREFGISESTLRNWEKVKDLKCAKIDGLKRYNIKEVDVVFRKSNLEYKPYPFDWFYFSYQDPERRYNINTKEEYFSHFGDDSLKNLFDEIEKNPWSTDKFEDYEFSEIKRGRSPLSHHRVVFRPKHQLRKTLYGDVKLLPVEFEIFCEMINATPVGEHKNNLYFSFDYVRAEPNFLTFTMDCCSFT